MRYTILYLGKVTSNETALPSELAVFLYLKHDPGLCSARWGFLFLSPGIAMDRHLLTEMLKRHEGLRLKPYLDTVGKLTIGYGRNIEDVGITQDEAELMLRTDISSAEQYLLTVDEYRKLDSIRQAVLVDMCFNLGFHGLMGFKNMWRAIRRRDWDRASAEMLNSKWARQVGVRAVELSDIMRTGEVVGG